METRSGIDELLAALPEVYQDVQVNGREFVGKRECMGRWHLMEPHIPPHGVILDVGSSLGYFPHRIAKEFPDTLVVSFESEPGMCDVQREIFRQEGIYNVVVCQHRLTLEDLSRWSKCVECFDLVLALSVLHHFPLTDVYNVHKALGTMTPAMFVEVPAINEIEACGGEAKDRAEGAVRSGCTWLGSTPSHLGDYTRDLWLRKSNVWRKDLDAYMGVAHEGGTKHQVVCGQGENWWVLNGKRIIPGVNVWNLLKFNVVWPPARWWIEQAYKAYGGLEFKSDARLWNLLATSRGLVAIDYTHVYPEGDQAEFKERDLVEMERYLHEHICGSTP